VYTDTIEAEAYAVFLEQVLETITKPTENGVVWQSDEEVITDYFKRLADTQEEKEQVDPRMSTPKHSCLRPIHILQLHARVPLSISTTSTPG